MSNEYHFRRATRGGSSFSTPRQPTGRPAAFYQQLQHLNLAEAWEKVTAAVMAVHGEYDWIMSGDDYKLLVNALNAKRPGSAEIVDWAKKQLIE